MNRENYDKKVLTTFNIIGCYFTNHYYNNLYRKARKLHDTYGRSSLTDEYKRVIRVYSEDITAKENLYKDMVVDLHKYYQSTVRVTSLLADFTNRILTHFLPEEHLGVMTDSERSFFLWKILGNIISDFSVYIADVEILKGVIDDHMNHANTRMWLEQIINIQMILREKLYRDFIRKGRPQTVDLETFQRMQEDRDKLIAKLKELGIENISLKDQLSNAKKIAEHLSLKISQLQAQQQVAPKRGRPVKQPPISVPVEDQLDKKISEATGSTTPRPSTPRNSEGVDGHQTRPKLMAGGAKRKQKDKDEQLSPSGSDRSDKPASPVTSPVRALASSKQANPFTDDIEDK